MGRPQKCPKSAKSEFGEMREKTLDLGYVLKCTEYDKIRPHEYFHLKKCGTMGLGAE